MNLEERSSIFLCDFVKLQDSVMLEILFFEPDKFFKT